MKLERFIEIEMAKLNIGRDKGTAKYIEKTKAATHVLQIRNWTISWQLPNLSVECPDVAICVKVSNMDKVNEYRLHNDQLQAIAHDVNRRILRILRDLAKIVAQNIKAADCAKRRRRQAASS